MDTISEELGKPFSRVVRVVDQTRHTTPPFFNVCRTTFFYFFLLLESNPKNSPTRRRELERRAQISIGPPGLVRKTLASGFFGLGV